MKKPKTLDTTLPPPLEWLQAADMLAARVQDRSVQVHLGGPCAALLKAELGKRHVSTKTEIEPGAVLYQDKGEQERAFIILAENFDGLEAFIAKAADSFVGSGPIYGLVAHAPAISLSVPKEYGNGLKLAERYDFGGLKSWWWRWLAAVYKPLGRADLQDRYQTKIRRDFTTKGGGLAAMTATLTLAVIQR